MRKILITFLYLLCFSFISFSQKTSPDLTIFGYTFGQPLKMPECPKELRPYGKGIKHYIYPTILPTATCDCYELKYLSYQIFGKKDKIPETKPLYNDTIQIYFQPSNWPDICASNYFYAEIVKSKLYYVNFKTNYSFANENLQAFIKKYGPCDILENRTLYNYNGAAIPYFVANWNFSNLIIQYVSLDTSTPNSKYGLVGIQFLDGTEKNTEQHGRSM